MSRARTVRSRRSVPRTAVVAVLALVALASVVVLVATPIALGAWSSAVEVAPTGMLNGEETDRQIAVTANYVHAVYRGPDGRIYYRRSVKGLDTWSAETTLSGSATSCAMPHIGTTGDHVYVAYLTTQSVAPTTTIEVRRNTIEGGAIWDTILSPSPPTESGSAILDPTVLDVVVTPENVAVLYRMPTNAPSGENGVWASYRLVSDPISAAWSRERWTGTDVTTRRIRSAAFYSAATDQLTYVMGHVPGSTPQLARTDDETTWTVLPLPAGAGAVGSLLQSVAASGTVVDLCWTASDGQVYHARSGDRGDTWGSSVNISSLTDGSTPTLASMATNGTQIQVVWAYERGSVRGIHHVTSPDNGTSWLPSRVLTEATGSDPLVVSLAADVTRGHLVWSHAIASDGISYSESTIEDMRPPVTTLSTAPVSPDGSNGFYVTDPTITLLSDEPGTTYRSLASSAGPWTAYSGAFLAGEGIKTLHYFSVDSVGNTETVRSVEFKVDLTDPEVFVSGVVDGGSYEDSVTINYGQTDANPGTTTAALDGASFFSGDTVSTEGTHSLEVTATDAAGREDTAAVSFQVVSLMGSGWPPHVPTEMETDACAMCHRAHSGASDAYYRTRWSADITMPALIVGTSSGVGDKDLCFACHGVGALGSGTDVEGAFSGGSGHSLPPSSSPFGPSPKNCSDCHDSHGMERDASGAPFPALLRSRDASNNYFYQGVAYCAACHDDRPADTWDGVDVWYETAHSRAMTLPATGTRIACSNCHEPHGSALPPAIRPTLYPPAAPATTTVSANSRWLCLVCHAGRLDTYPPGLTYQASAHGVSTRTVAAAGEWAAREASRTSVETSRAVGECQNCHAPMGARGSDGSATVEMLVREGRALCDRCHDSNGPAAADLATLAVPPATANYPELFASYDPSVAPTAFGRLAAYSQETTTGTPRALVGPLEFPASGRSGDVAFGDIDGDGEGELVMADPAGERLRVLRPSAVHGLEWVFHAIGVSPRLLLVDDLILDGSGRPEIAVVTGTGSGPATLYVYRYVGATLTTLTPGGIGVGNGASSMASGDVRGSAAADLVVTAAADDQFRILSEAAGVLAVADTVDTSATPRGASIGDAWDGVAGEAEIVIANSGSVASAVAVYDGSGALLDAYAVSGVADGRAWDTLVADVLPGSARTEAVVAVRSATATSSVNVFTSDAGGGLSGPLRIDTGPLYNTGTLAAGDIDGDGRVEVVAGSGGSWEPSGLGIPASLQVFHHNGLGTALLAPDTLWAGGVELAGEPPAVIVADLGGSLVSRHPVGAVAEAHVSTETAVLAQHVECMDCHNVHEATSTPAAVPASTAPAAYGRIAGAWGVSVENQAAGQNYTLTEARGVTTEYGVCLKCHSVWSQRGPSRDIASEVNTRNASEHSVEWAGPTGATGGSFEAPWAPGSILYCVDCHGRSDPSGPAGPHRSASAPLLRAPYQGIRSSDAQGLCYSCHKRTVYYSGAEDDTSTGSNSQFYRVSPGYLRLHAFHVAGRGFSCSACHASHGSPTEARLMKTSASFEASSTGGKCVAGCHSTTVGAYSRVP